MGCSTRAIRLLAALGTVVCLLAGSRLQAAEDDVGRYEAVAKRLITAINSGDADAVQAEFAQIMRDAFPPEKATPSFAQMISVYGKIEKIGEGRVVRGGQAIFALHCKGAPALDMKIVLDDSDKVTGLWFTPHAEEQAPPPVNSTALYLPFEGRWRTFWGGDTREVNRHHDTRNQRFAFDFVTVDEEGRDHTGDGTRNEDYFAFGREILAPAAGEVTEAIDGVRDNTPGSMNPYCALGNAVFISHSDGEVSVIAHLKCGSVRLKQGETVAAGEIIGLCGNSGNSSQPHLHYHLQNTPVIQDGVGIKVFFENVAVIGPDGGVDKGRYSPVKGDVVCSSAGADAETGAAQ